jgi:oligopeptide transport system substrate-binding protein
MKIICVYSLLLLSIFSCNNDKNPLYDYAGGSVKLSLETEPATYISRDVGDIYSANVLSQVMECLVSINPKDLSVSPQIAKSWKISEDGLSYEFTVRNNILFHTSSVFNSEKERILSVDDVKKTIEFICSQDESGKAGVAYSLVFEQYLKGAKSFYNKKSKNISGLKVKGNKITFVLNEKDNNFLNKMAHISCAIISHKIIESNLEQDMIGTGPFIFREYKKGVTNSIVLTKNEDYYLTDENGFALPYLDSVIYVLESRKLEQLDLFEQKKLDLIVGLPASRISKMLEGRISDFNSTPPLLVLQNNPILTTNFYFFNMKDERFKKLKVRQAFNYAIDKEQIGIDILRNQFSELGYYGIVPPIPNAFRGYDYDGIKSVSYSFNPEKARQLLAEAGYPGGKGFGTVNLRFNINDVHSAVADEFSKQIFQVLGINVNIDASSFEQLEKDAKKGNSEIFRAAWTADYASPETFLFNFYGKIVPSNKSVLSPINHSRYVNSEFDNLFELAKKSTKLSDQMSYFSKAEKVLMQDPPIIPLWYKGDYGIVYSNVRNLNFNSLNIYNFVKVYKKEWTKEEYLKSIKNVK